MFSLDKFYNILHSNLINPIIGSNSNRSQYFNDFGDSIRLSLIKTSLLHCYFFDQEPFYEYTKSIVDYIFITNPAFVRPNQINILANSEKSQLLTDYTKSNNLYNWYYFFHGFAALDWYRDFQYAPPHYFERFDKVFICYNHLTSKYRSYRLHLVSNLIDQDLVKFGHVSLFLRDKHGTWEDTVRDPTTLLSNKARVHIFKTLKNITEPLIIDTDTPSGAMSADKYHRTVIDRHRYSRRHNECQCQARSIN